MSTFVPSTINIASEPFRRERAQNAMLASLCAILAVCFVVLVGLIVHSRSQAADIRREINVKTARLAGLQSAQRKYSAVLAKPGNADVFSTSVFLNQLIARRAVSWTRVFEDLQTVLPENMELLSIRLPQVPAEDASGTNRVQLDMLVGTEHPEAVITMLKRLETSKLFGAASVTTQTPPNQNDPLYKYRLTVAYAQKL